MHCLGPGWRATSGAGRETPELAWLSNMMEELSWERTADPSPPAPTFCVQMMRQQLKSTGRMSGDVLLVTRRLQAIGHQMRGGLTDLPEVRSGVEQDDTVRLIVDVMH